MKRYCSALLMFGLGMSTSVWASPPSNEDRTSSPAVVMVSARDANARSKEQERRQILADHTSWRWIVQVQAKQKDKIRTGLLLGMQGIGTTGPVRSLAWLDMEGEPRWMVMQHVDEKGRQVFQMRDNFKQGTWTPVDAARLSLLIEDATGTSADLDTLHAWVSGVPSGLAWPARFIRDDAGVHPVQALTRQGKIVWGQWSTVKTGKGQDLALPGGWMITRRGYEAVFASMSMEAYEPDELPNQGWPFIEKKDPSRFLLEEEEPIASQDQLDYEQW